MKNIEPWTLKVFSYHLAILRTKNLSKDNIELTVQIGGGITIVFPLFLACAVVVFLLSPVLGPDSVKMPGIVAILVIIFGVMRITDKIYDRNIDHVQSLAEEIRLSKKRGTWWAVKQLLKLYLGYLATAGIVFLLLRLFIDS